MPEFEVAYIVFGLISASVIAVMGIGLTLQAGISRFFNISYGELVTLGAFSTYTFSVTWAFPLFLAIPVTCVVVAVASVGLNWTVFRPMRNSNAWVLLIASLGVSFFLSNLFFAQWGSRVRRLDVPDFLSDSHKIGDVVITGTDMMIVAAVIIISMLLYLMLQRTGVGKAMRATADDPGLAAVTGINPEKVSFYTWLLAGALAGLGGTFFAMTGFLEPQMGTRIILLIGASVVVGGVGNPWGALAGAFVVGMSMELSVMFINPGLKLAVAFAALVIALLIRPQGILGQKGFL